MHLTSNWPLELFLSVQLCGIKQFTSWGNCHHHPSQELAPALKAETVPVRRPLHPSGLALSLHWLCHLPLKTPCRNAHTRLSSFCDWLTPVLRSQVHPCCLCVRIFFWGAEQYSIVWIVFISKVRLVLTSTATSACALCGLGRGGFLGRNSPCPWPAVRDGVSTEVKAHLSSDASAILVICWVPGAVLEPSPSLPALSQLPWGCSLVGTGRHLGGG
jgi:hypothetical protein